MASRDTSTARRPGSPPRAATLPHGRPRCTAAPPSRHPGHGRARRGLPGGGWRPSARPSGRVPRSRSSSILSLRGRGRRSVDASRGPAPAALVGAKSMTRKRVAVVIGGGNGIGEATCRLMSARGWRVLVVDRDVPAAERVAHDIDAAAFAMDLARRGKRRARGGGHRRGGRRAHRAHRRGCCVPGRASAGATAAGGVGAHDPGQSDGHLARQPRVRHAHGGARRRQHRQHRVDRRDRLDARARVWNQQGGRRRAYAQPRRRMGTRRGARQRRIAWVHAGAARGSAHPVGSLRRRPRGVHGTRPHGAAQRGRRSDRIPGFRARVRDHRREPRGGRGLGRGVDLGTVRRRARRRRSADRLSRRPTRARGASPATASCRRSGAAIVRDSVARGISSATGMPLGRARNRPTRSIAPSPGKSRSRVAAWRSASRSALHCAGASQSCT